MQDRRYQACIIQQFEALIHHVLTQWTLPNGSYDDYAQELRLKLLDLAQAFEGDPLGADRYPFVAYARRGLRWQLMDLVKQDSQPDALPLETFQETLSAPDPQPDSQLVLHQALAQVQAQLPASHHQLLTLRLQGYSMTECSQVLGVSRKTLYKWRQALADFLSQFYPFG